MTAYELKRIYQTKKPDGHFFDKETLKFFGESLSQMKVEKGPFEHTDYRGVKHQCYRLTTKQLDWNGNPKKEVFLFDIETMQDFHIDE